MRRRGGIWAAGWVLFGLLAIATGLLVLGQREYLTQPSVFSYGPSGTHALVELLRAEGFEVTIDRSEKPKLGSEDLALGFHVKNRDFNIFDNPDMTPTSGPRNPIQRSIAKHVESGGRALVCELPASFLEASRTASMAPRKVSFGTGTSPDIYSTSKGSSDYFFNPALPLGIVSNGFTVARDADNIATFKLYDHGSGMLGVLYDSIACTNRFIDAEQNAAYVLKIIKTLDPGNGRIVLIEALGGQAVQTGLLATIGPWALAAWWQLIFVFVALAFTLGRRFGLPELAKYSQRGGKELVDAYADVMLRSRKPHLALKKIVDEVDREVRKRYSISADLPPKRRNETLPEGLAIALSRAELATQSPLPDSSAVDLLKRLEWELGVVGVERKGRRRRKR